MTRKIYFLLCITSETRLVSLYGNRVIYTGISIRTIFVINFISRLFASHALINRHKAIPCIIRDTSITGCIDTYLYIFIDFRIQIHTGIESRIIIIGSQTILINIT